MITEKIDLYAYFQIPRKSATGGYLTSYRHDPLSEMGVERERPAMLVIAGGAYAFVSQREAEPIALEYFGQGFECFTLDYSVAPAHHYPTMLEEAGMAMVYLRRESKAMNLKENHIAAVGFSAGGHLCGCISLLWDDPALKALFPEEYESIRPDASVYSYAVISFGADTHGGTAKNFCDTVAERAEYSLDKKVRASASPSFIWATTTDNAVPVSNSVKLYSALVEQGVPAELHLFEQGSHGMACSNFETTARPTESAEFYAHIHNWLPLSFEFLRLHGFIAGNKGE